MRSQVFCGADGPRLILNQLFCAIRSCAPQHDAASTERRFETERRLRMMAVSLNMQGKLLLAMAAAVLFAAPFAFGQAQGATASGRPARGDHAGRGDPARAGQRPGLCCCPGGPQIRCARPLHCRRRTAAHCARFYSQDIYTQPNGIYTAGRCGPALAPLPRFVANDSRPWEYMAQGVVDETLSLAGRRPCAGPTRLRRRRPPSRRSRGAAWWRA